MKFQVQRHCSYPSAVTFGLPKLSLFILCMTGVVVFTLPAFAGTIDYAGPGPGPGGMTGWTGDTVWYGGVSESNTEGTMGDDGQTAMLFGAPTGVSGNTIDFDPVGFSASSSGGGAPDITDGQLNFMVMATAGNYIESLQLSEAGDTTLAGVGTDITRTVVTAEVFIDILQVDGHGTTQTLNIQAELVFTPSDGDYLLSTDSGGDVFYQTDWSGFLLVDLEQALIDASEPYVSGVTKISVAIDNTLTALSETNTSSLIAKKDFDGLSVTAVVPEPASVLLLAIGSLGFAARRQPR